MAAIVRLQNVGGILIAPGAGDGTLVTRPGQVQYGPMLMGGGTSARWRQLTGWRDLPDAQIADSPRPQAHGAYPGSVYGDALTVTYDFLLRGRYADKVAALATIERYAPMDGVERALVIDDGDGPWMRQARVIARSVPQDQDFRQGPVECSLQFLCADPRRYSLTERRVTSSLPSSSGGLVYPLTYPLDYGTSSSGAATAYNDGAVAAPLVVTFRGPLVNPVLVASDWRLAFNITLAAGETLIADTAEGTALLNGTADRLYTIRNDSDPMERCVLRPGSTNLSLIADGGTGTAVVSYHDTRM